MLNLGSRSAAEGTLNHGFYLYGHVHKLLFTTISGNNYTPIFENVKIQADGTYEIPKLIKKLTTFRNRFTPQVI